MVDPPEKYNVHGIGCMQFLKVKIITLPYHMPDFAWISHALPIN